MSEPSGRPGPGVAAGAAATVAGGLLLGALQGWGSLPGEALGEGARGYELGYWALAIGLLVGAVLGKVGGQGRAIALWGVPLALAGVALAQLLAAAIQVGAGDVHLEPGPVLDYWQHEILGRNDVTFYAVAAAEAYLVARRVAE
ncbi:hypothetical protein [Streptomyces sp. KR80]|uniref:hypothetical protein n=1 Tax=Streptomyces sp. KR80 TaxID=3457426 RepID=UPI003FD2C824